ncbi:MAG: Hsp33 family molecular chaperone HslO [Stomatobaculum sp.]|nr:Hsp33 family molecular chaperone HslO [Stomatobaculum sp.]
MKDQMVRAFAADGMIRAFAASTGNLVEEARAIHNTAPVVTAALGRMLTAGVMMGAMMKNPEDRLTIKIDGAGPMRGVLVTADCSGHVKGYPYENMVILPPNAKGKLDVSGAIGAGILTVISDTGLKEPYVGQVELVSGEIAEDIAYYYASSEQVPSSVGLGVLVNPDSTVNCAGGFIIQLMPGCPEETISGLEECMKDVTGVTDILKEGKTAEEMLRGILAPLDPVVTDTMDCSFYCNCSRERVSRALMTVGEKELRSMISDGKPVELSCHFCGKSYTFSVKDLERMLKTGGAS